jgi:Cys-tRNA(Pro)/Cys-tRNA(Cys) deacylase
MTELPPVARALAERRIPYRLFVHTGPVHSLEQAAHERNQLPDQVIRSIVFRVGKDEFLMALMAGNRQISWPALRRYLGQSRLTLATEDEVRSVTGYERGAVAPFGLPRPLRILVDESVFAHAEVSLGSGVRGTAVIMTSIDLRQALGDVEIVNLGES